MVASARFISVYSPSGITDYYLRETQPRHERDMDREYMRLPDPGEHDGTVPELRRDISDQAARSLALTPGRTPTRQEVYNILSGARADGGPTGKQIVSDYTRQDGREFKQKHCIDVTISSDVTVGLVMANSETQAGRARIMSAFDNAANDTMTGLADHLGYTRRGAGGSGGLEKGEIAWIKFTHHTTRPSSDGTISPNLHTHFVIPNALRLPTGEVRGIATKLLLHHGGDLSRQFEDKFAHNLQKIGVEFTREGKSNSVILTDVPRDVRQEFIKRGPEMRAYAEQHGTTMRRAGIMTQGSNFDGVANRPEWRRKLHALGVPPRDVATGAPRLAIITSANGVMGQISALVMENLPQRLERLRRDAVDNLQLARQVRERPGPGLSIATQAQLSRALAPAIVRQALALQMTAQAMRRAPGMAAGMARSIRHQAAARQAVPALVYQLTHTLQREDKPTMAPIPGRTATPAPIANPAEPDGIERLVRVYAAKVARGDMSFSAAVDAFVNAEQDQVKATGYNPVHQTYSYPKGSPGPENRYQREEKWGTRIADAVEKVYAGTAWDDVLKPAVERAQAQPTMKMQR